MAGRGAPLQNQNARRGRQWREAIKRALSRAAAKLNQGDEIGWRRGLDRVADEIVGSAISGEAWAIREIGNRIDGKPIQAISGPHGEVPKTIPIIFIDPQKRLEEEKPTLELIE